MKKGTAGSISALVINGIGWLFGLVVLGWTGYRSWHILYTTVAEDNSVLKFVIPVLGLVIFEGGMLYWFFNFVKKAEGTPQKAVSIVAAVLDTFFVLIAFLSDVTNATGAGMMDKAAPVALVGIATAVNLIAKIADYITSPEVLHSIKIGGHSDTIRDMAYQQLKDEMTAIADEKAKQYAGQLRGEVLGQTERMLNAKPGGNGQSNRAPITPPGNGQGNRPATPPIGGPQRAFGSDAKAGEAPN
ncbi:MAG: hypothetical protein HY868_25450 [Chloroflexi bacterium]|nr:hypothetical protein [Chloroflexota bacterium]